MDVREPRVWIVIEANLHIYKYPQKRPCANTQRAGKSPRTATAGRKTSRTDLALTASLLVQFPTNLHKSGGEFKGSCLS